MITAVDTNIFLDIFLPDPEFGDISKRLLRQAYDEGALIVCDIVYAELVPQFSDRSLLNEALEKINVSTSSVDKEVAFLAGQEWSEYRNRGGARERIITDFLIGAHALLEGDRFLTRDRGFYGTYFP
jgi:predicted nucleic acid-binding protein